MRLPKIKPWMTAALVVGIALSAIAVLAIGWGVLEAVTLADDEPGNHITAVWRDLWAKEPGAILLALLVLTNFLTGTLGYIAGHIFWCNVAALKRQIRELQHQLRELRRRVKRSGRAPSESES